MLEENFSPQRATYCILLLCIFTCGIVGSIWIRVRPGGWGCQLKRSSGSEEKHGVHPAYLLIVLVQMNLNRILVKVRRDFHGESIWIIRDQGVELEHPSWPGNIWSRHNGLPHGLDWTRTGPGSIHRYLHAKGITLKAWRSSSTLRIQTIQRKRWETEDCGEVNCEVYLDVVHFWTPAGRESFEVVIALHVHISANCVGRIGFVTIQLSSWWLSLRMHSAPSNIIGDNRIQCQVNHDVKLKLRPRYAETYLSRLFCTRSL